MQIYRVTAKIEYLNIKGNTHTAEFSIDDCQSMSGDDNIRREALTRWLDSQHAPVGIVRSDVTDWISFRAEQWTDEERSEKHGAIQKGLF